MHERFEYVQFYALGPLVIGILIIVPFWKLFSKAGYCGWLVLLMLVPVINILVLYLLAFADWPALRHRRGGEQHAVGT